MNAVFETLQRLFRNKEIDEAKLSIAVAKGYITENQKIQILSEQLPS